MSRTNEVQTECFDTVLTGGVGQTGGGIDVECGTFGQQRAHLRISALLNIHRESSHTFLTQRQTLISVRLAQ